jgi:toxin HigB-1
MPIKSFKCPETEALFRSKRTSRFASIERTAFRKLLQLDMAERLEDLRVPPGNRLELLSGDRSGRWSVRINARFRMCFLWTGSDAEEVEIVDYH